MIVPWFFSCSCPKNFFLEQWLQECDKLYMAKKKKKK